MNAPVTAAHYALAEAIYQSSITGMHPSTPEGRAAVAQLIANAEAAAMEAKLQAILDERREVVTRIGALNTTLRAALDDIHLTAHCLAKAGPLVTPTLDVAWSHFNRIAAKATAALARKGES